MQNIYTLGQSDVIDFAAGELAKYVQRLAGTTLAIATASAHNDSTPGIWLGLCTSYPLRMWPKLKSSTRDDAFSIRQVGDQLQIAGANERSVLFAVYAYLERLGVRWIRPGTEGELLPELDHLPTSPFTIYERASYRHRGICIEGAPSLDHALNMVDWMAKSRMNSFFLQFQHSGTFWERWYSHAYNPDFSSPQKLDENDYVSLDKAVIAEIKKRGLILHQVGHGWTAAALDLPHNGWQRTNQAVAPKKKRWLARLNGRRDLFHQTPINTELCYSYKPAFNALIDTITAYAKAHPEVDVLHFWLSDAMNNKCECAQCAVLSPSDWYVKLVNAFSERLHELGPDRRFVFLVYFESWWAPTRLKVSTRRGNAILMFAPISRCFKHALTDEACTLPFSVKRPALNAAHMPRANHPFIRLLDRWWNAYTGDSFLFDYHLWSGLHNQACDVNLSKVIHDDMRDLKRLGLNGMISCQVLRSFWPTGLPMSAMARTLWNRNLGWRQIKQEFFQDAYGADAEWVDKYLAGLEKLLLAKQEHDDEHMESKQPRQLRLIDAFLQAHYYELLARADKATIGVHRASLRLLAHHNQFLLMKCQTVLGKLPVDDFRNWLLSSEHDVHPYLDIQVLMARQRMANK